MSNVVSVWPYEHERFPEAARQDRVTEQLNGISSMLRDVLPSDAVVSFAFDGNLQVHIDVRKREDVILVENLLPNRAGGLLRRITRGATPRRPFFHRLSALVNS